MPLPLLQSELEGMSNNGLTLPELVLSLLLLGVAAQTLLGPIRHQADLLAVRSGREEIVALVRRARIEARRVGAAKIVLEEGIDPVLLLDAGRPPARVPLTARGIRLDVLGSRSAVTLSFGPLGVAQFGSASLVLSRRGATSRLVVSSYGRVRR